MDYGNADNAEFNPIEKKVIIIIITLKKPTIILFFCRALFSNSDKYAKNESGK